MMILITACNNTIVPITCTKVCCGMLKLSFSLSLNVNNCLISIADSLGRISLGFNHVHMCSLVSGYARWSLVYLTTCKRNETTHCTGRKFYV